MRRTAMAIAVLLATAPVAGATEITPEIKPEVRAVEVAAPTIRQNLVVAPAQAEVRSAKATTRATQMDRHTWTIVIIALAVAAAALFLL